MTIRITKLASSLVLLLLGACSSPRTEEPASLSGQNAEAAYEAIEVTNGGSISGVVRFTGTPPKLEPRQLNEKNPEICGHGSKPSQEILLGREGGLQNVVIAIADIRRGKRIEAPAPALDQRECDYSPHVQAATAGSILEIRNSDDLLHNVHGKLDGRATLFNLAMPLKGQILTRQLTKPGVIALQCDAGHTWMKAYIVVLEHPYYTITSEGGSFQIQDIPPGTYKVRAWHEKLGSLEQEVLIGSGAETEVSFSYP